MAHSHMAVVEESGARLREVGLDTPNWEALADGLRPDHRNRSGSLAKSATSRRNSLQRRCTNTTASMWCGPNCLPMSLVRSQSGPLSSVPFTVMPMHRVSKLDSEPFRVLLLRRLPLPFTVCTCRCGHPFDAFGHHRAAYSTGGLLGRRGFAAVSTIAQIFREGGARVSTNVMVSDFDVAPPHRSDLHRLEVVVEGLTLFGGCQLIGH